MREDKEHEARAKAINAKMRSMTKDQAATLAQDMNGEYNGPTVAFDPDAPYDRWATIPGVTKTVSVTPENRAAAAAINLERALKVARSLKRNIDRCRELSDAYIFFSTSDELTDGGDSPVVILKGSMQAVNMIAYAPKSTGTFIREFEV